MTTLAVDIETYASVDLPKCGAYAYADAADFETLLIAWALDDGPVYVHDWTTGPIPPELNRMLTDPDIVKTAYNANFERTCLARALGRPFPPEQWRCTAVHAATLGLPPSLGAVTAALGLAEDEQKSKIGAALIRYFCKPCKESRANGGRTRNLPTHDPERWASFTEYCRQDVIAERAVRQALERFPVPDGEQRLWALDQRINDRGVAVDTVLMKQAIDCDRAHAARLLEEAEALTQLPNPNSVAQLKAWLLEAADLEVESLNKKVIPQLLKQTDDAVTQRVLMLRQEMARTSVKKYAAMERSLCRDGRIHGTLRFYGASRTGRWGGSIVQPQNLPQNHLKDLALARELVREGHHDMLALLYGDVPDALSQLVRTALIPRAGCRFIVADFSAIEARIVAWLAGERWRLEVFATHGRIYEASAAAMFRVPIETITKGSPLRQKGKISELALGYGGSIGALKSMGALDMGLEEDELQPLVDAWRTANPRITKFWWAMGAAALLAAEGKPHDRLPYGVKFQKRGGILFLRLPSGRQLAYMNPRIETDLKRNKPQLTYDGADAKSKKWQRSATYGPKLVENLVQAVARDCLAAALLRLEARGYVTVFHVHDEVVLEVPEGEGSVEDVCGVLSQPLRWAPGLNLKAEGYETPFYCKD